MLGSALAIGALTSCSDSDDSKKSASGSAKEDFRAAREGFVTKLTRKESENEPAPEPPPMMFEKIAYTSPAGDLSAYVSPDPDDGERHPVVIWLTGGFSNSISSIAWETMERENDQTASAFRKAGLLMMYPSLRGGNDNPWHKEFFLGEVDDVLAAAEHLKSLDYVDPDRIYLGGHSTGGTLVLLVAAAAPEGTFRAVFSLGPADDPATYGPNYVPYDTKNKLERELRAPIEWLDAIETTTLVFEGEDGNLWDLQKLQRAGKNNEHLSFFPIYGEDHFNIIAPVTELLAGLILRDSGDDRAFDIKLEDVEERMEAQLPPPRRPFPAGDPISDFIVFEYGIYLRSEMEEAEAVGAVRDLVESDFPELKLIAEDAEPSGAREVSVIFESEVAQFYAPPDLDSLRFKGVGLSREEGEALQDSPQAIRIWFTHSDEDALAGLKTANRLVAKLAAQADGWPWDEQTRQVFSQEGWQIRRVNSWSGNFPDTRMEVTMHAYRNGDSIRAITLGMEKFGLPDVLVDRMSWAENQQMASLINAFCQLLIEGNTIVSPNRFDLDLSRIQNESVREQLLAEVIEDGTGKGVIALKIGPWDLGDPINRLIEIYPDDYEGPDLFAQQNAMLSAIFGFKDEVRMVEADDEALEAASERAKAKMPALRKLFNAGLDPNEHIHVKAPFTTDDDGVEWMWVAVSKWDEDGTIRGTLSSEPRFVEDLSAGQEVEVQEADLFDYIHSQPDGSLEGNETGEIIRRMQEAR